MKEVYRPGFESNPAKSKTDLPLSDLGSRASSLALCSSREARALLDYNFAVQWLTLPLSVLKSKNSSELKLAVAEELTPENKKQIKFLCGMDISCCLIDRELLCRAIERAYKADDYRLQSALSPLKASSRSEHPQIFIGEVEDNEPVPRALKILVEYAIAREATDIHLTPYIDGLKLKLRIKGELLNYNEPVCSLQVLAQLISRIKVLSNLRTDIKALPQDGSFSLQTKEGRRQIRVSTMPTVHGEKCVLRITSKAPDYTLKNLGLSCETSAIIDEVIRSRSGLILLSGSTGSGKTTSLYAIVQELVKINLNVVSIEDPVEAQIEGVSQTCLDPGRGLDYPTALKAILRQDPDVILVGEIRDLQSAELVISAALSGHLVLSSIHASNIKDSVTRLIEMGCSQAGLAGSLKLLLNQSLVQKLCAKCKVLDLHKSNLYNLKVYRAVGCNECEYSGFSGRLLAVERIFLQEQTDSAQFISSYRSFMSNNDKYEPKSVYLESYLKEGLILPSG